MRIFGFESFGGPEVAGFLTVPSVPSVPDGAVLIAPSATTVNPADIKVRSGQRQGSFPVHFPMAMGREAAGVVLAASPATDITPGTAVFGPTFSGTGSFSEEVLLDASATTPIPPGVSAQHAACLPVAAGTAWDILNELHRDGLRSGRTILILGAGGGVGHCAVQLALALGYRVTGVAGASKQSLVESLGATFIASGKYWIARVNQAGPVDAIIDLVGGQVLIEAMTLTDGPVRSIADPALGGGVTRRRSRAVFTELASLVAEGTFTPRITASFPFADAAQAIAAVESGHASGKTVVTF